MESMKAGKPKTYVSMWAKKDIDGTHCIYREDNKGNVDIAPFTFATKESAAIYIRAHFPDQQILSV